MRKWIAILENSETYTLYHGTCSDSATKLLRNGWSPNSGTIGANQGQPYYLYLTTTPENALWFAEQKGCSTILKVTVPASFLRVDPEDGIANSVGEELSSPYGLPGSVICIRALAPENFSIHSGLPISNR